VRRNLIVAAALAATACSFAPSYRRPDNIVPPQHRFAKPDETRSIADLPWWEAFKDPVLQDLVREALAKNQDLALATARVAEARALVGFAGADLWPQVTAGVSAGGGQPISESLGGPSKAQGRILGDVGVSWELDLWGRVRNGRDAAIADLLATEDGRHAVVLSLVSDVAQAYLELRALDLQLEIARTNAQLRQETLDLFEKRSKGGVGNDLEVNQARADLAVTQATIPQTEMFIWMKEHQLCVLLGRIPGPIPRGKQLVDTPELPDLPAGVPTQLLARRPDLLAAEQGIVAAGARVGVAVANRFPTLSLTGFIGLQARSGAGFFDPGALAWNAAGGLLAPIFLGGKLSSLEDASRAQLEQSVAVYQKTVQVALAEVADASGAAVKQREIRAARQVQVTSTLAASRLALARYQGGVSNYLEVLDAQRQQFDAQLSLANAVRDELTSTVQLYRTLGGGWEQMEASPAAAAQPAAKPAAGK